jgi:putative membrane protein
MSEQPGPNELRDHLANERTFLAWMRTGITVVALGFVAAKSDAVSNVMGSRPIHTGTGTVAAVVGVALVLAGMLIAGLGFIRFWQTRRNIDRGVVEFAATLDVTLAILVGLTGVLLAVYLIHTA